MRFKALFVAFVLMSFYGKAQHLFSGQIDKAHWHENVYLSVIEDYRKISGVYPEQIIAKVTADSLGYFQFTGNQLENEHRIYRIHVDNCIENEQDANHFSGHCDDSKEIVFIAKHNDTINFPFSFNKQMFCDVKSDNEQANAFIKIDSLKEDMRFAFGEFRSEANRKLNNKKWFKTLQDYGKQLNEPIAELYIYAFLSERSNSVHSYYLEDLKNNNYYDDLLTRLEARYPNSPYTKQYRSELTSDEYILSNTSHNSSFNWTYLLYLLFAISILGNLWFWLKLKANKNQFNKTTKEQLTNQEQKILDLLLNDNTNKEIAESLFVSLSTVKTHINNIYRKLNVQSRDEAKSLFNK
ncbi:helix-turn-helix domain-containing protein [Gaetbulibacter sp. NE]|uniref:helix-turn-helix domain-containing protein n=1 Tax=Gaetbulibacter sp. NE TaxID=2982307 RepID=UPI0021D2A8B3|nr:helix-turn-helix transcriptional regulator [Gaetbulibacter sp. NE]